MCQLDGSANLTVSHQCTSLELLFLKTFCSRSHVSCSIHRWDQIVHLVVAVKPGQSFWIYIIMGGQCMFITWLSFGKTWVLPWEFPTGDFSICGHTMIQCTPSTTLCSTLPALRLTDVRTLIIVKSQFLYISCLAPLKLDWQEVSL